MSGLSINLELGLKQNLQLQLKESKGHYSAWPRDWTGLEVKGGEHTVTYRLEEPTAPH